MKNKKAFSVITSTILLLLVAITTGILTLNWHINFQQNYTDNKLEAGKVGPLEIKELKTNGTYSIIGVMNKGETYHQIDNVKINLNDCSPSGQYIVVETDLIQVNCSVTIGNTYQIDVFSNHGVYTKTLTVFE